MILTIAALIPLAFIACDRDAPTQPVVRAGKATGDDCALCDFFDVFNNQQEEEDETPAEEAETDSTSSEGGPDLIVQSPSVRDSILTPGQAFTLHVTVHNQGDQQAAATVLRYYRSNNATISASDTQVGTGAVDSLDASTTSEQSIELTASVGAERYYGACVESVRGESNTDNNCSSAVKITVSEQETEDEEDADEPAKGSAASDRAALVAFYEATGGDNWLNSDNWVSEAALHEWHGVETDDNGRVTTLALSGNQLSGPIPPELGQLENLQGLYLSGNQLSGSIPPQLGQLNNLRTLELGFNQLSGPIPPELGQLNNLQTLSLGRNQLSGSIPPQLGQLENLQTLSLSGNELSGSIPPELGQLNNLEVLNLFDNQLSGSIPPQLGQLELLRLGDNELSGCIPASLRAIPYNDLDQLGLADCDGVGSPAADRAVLSVFYNAMSGILWDKPYNWQSETSLSEWYGVTTDANGRVTKLELADNLVLGYLPAELGDLEKLEVLDLSDNLLIGLIPPELGNLTNLKKLDLSSNLLEGPIPPELGNLTNLQVLNLEWNLLKGNFPPELGDLTNLQVLRVSGFDLDGMSGCIPASLRAVPDNDLFWLRLPNCGGGSAKIVAAGLRRTGEAAARQALLIKQAQVRERMPLLR